jgi:hypothetical protein
MHARASWNIYVYQFIDVYLSFQLQTIKYQPIKIKHKCMHMCTGTVYF